MQEPKLEKKTRCFGGWNETYSHESESTKTPMRFAVYRPTQAETSKVPTLFWLSGLTCTEENFMTKAGAQKLAEKHGVLLVAPDTSPRGLNLPGEHDSWDFGSGAGFYVNATQVPWSTNYNMYDYVVKELPAIIGEFFPADLERQGIFGHSMGGHGALIAALKNPGRYRSVSAFAPITSPTQVPWGEKAFSNYLGTDKSTWKAYDANELVKTADEKLPILIDQGLEDNFLTEQLRPGIFESTCKEIDYPLQLNLREGYDHSYFFIASFIESHFAHHLKFL